MRLGKFRPASDEKGLAVRSVWSDEVEWKPKATGTTRYTRPPAKLVLGVPKGDHLKRIVRIDAAFVVEPDGSASSCQIHKPVRLEALNQMACEAVRGMRFDPVLAADGHPVRAVRTFSIAFQNDAS
jgi:hypothetical protein